jgi:hypothetical protein
MSLWIRSGIFAFTACGMLFAVPFASGQPTPDNAPAAPAGAPAAESPATEPAQPATTQDKRIFGVLPNYRTADGTAPFQPINTKRKFYIAMKDSFDYPIYPLSAAFASLYQLENSNPSFGQGVKGYAHRLVTSYGDQVVGNMMTEALMPSLLREDPRYFRKVYGTKRSRLGYAVTRVFVTRTDAGGSRFNFSEWVGNGAAVAISNAYYPDTRTVSDNVQKLCIQVATDAFSQVLKEFWPDVKRKLFKKKTADELQNSH